ncbi:50S ribosomal protein L25/general stress protein Ctc [Aetokthonos hydrillicola Thurmond2011]|jgi:large subunit ribosomal protein L25|uniref:Large ribosomal subunit protein bL25 n=1 Tax=Aetokthonos hydrillicola Thurmond2011 TaxID=2712845 RepID=A0AAP5IFE1_9CYAN|nr:50S ribosomal protein L25/general stress protein Ctc [Aetokthonos hydrillicola]MBO3461690.1 50S ribosomal protein L25/general stress protein Ctc [Aetokthonos hydrillicola CCALA 1050]MBW4590004.1 50S ribosomal protein L25/general stress protein Ctc [Aetokthonos hydrillicola CCALA 1050]MDR9900586.1 50S ribosomal protein L25/general stress protein Ctc [Aetokthonos hydrillicola Thurmond2011]
MDLTIECQKRPEGSKPNALRRSGKIPANLYGHKGTESIALTLDTKVVEQLLKKGSVNNTLIDLKITDIPWSGKTLLREVQIHPAKRTPYHLSFFAVAGHGDTDVEVSLHFVGEAVGVKQEGGVLDTPITQLQIRCAPENIPEAIEVNVSELHVGDSLHTDELSLPEGVKIIAETGQVVVSVLPPQTSADTGSVSEGT